MRPVALASQSLTRTAACLLTHALRLRRFDTFPLISWVIVVFGPLLNAYYSSSFTPFFVFFALFLAVVRNEKLPHFMRFNAMQSILLDICIMLGACAGCLRGESACERAWTAHAECVVARAGAR